MIAILVAFAGALLIAAGTEVIGFEFPSRPVLWAGLILIYPLADGLGQRVRPRCSGILRLCLFLLFDATITYPLGYAAWSLHELGWMGQSLPSLGILLSPAAASALWASPWLHRRQREVEAEMGSGPERFFPWLWNRVRIVLVPAALLATLVALTDRIEASQLYQQAQVLHPGIPAALCGVAMIALFIASPLFVLLLWPTTPFPEGALREAMEAAAGARQIGPLAIRVWDERTRYLVNACAVGLCPAARGIIFTSGILRLLDRNQLFAVFCHELAHLSRRHLSSFAALAVAFLLSVPLLEAATSFLPGEVAWGLICAYGIVFWLFLFGAISRRFETEADCIAAESAGVGSYLSALQRVADLTGPSIRRNGWRHLSVERRLEILARAAADPGVIQEARIQGQQLRRSIAVFLIVTAALFLALPAFAPRSSSSGNEDAGAAVEAVERFTPVALSAARRWVSPGAFEWLARDPRTVLADWNDLCEWALEATLPAPPAAAF